MPFKTVYSSRGSLPQKCKSFGGPKASLLNGISRAEGPDNPIPGGSGSADEGDEDDGDVTQQDRVHAAVNINLLCFNQGYKEMSSFLADQ